LKCNFEAVIEDLMDVCCVCVCIAYGLSVWILAESGMWTDMNSFCTKDDVVLLHEY
jgi:hypothetical protein